MGDKRCAPRPLDIRRRTGRTGAEVASEDRVIDRLKVWATDRLGLRIRATPSRALPPGADEIRLLETPEALRLAELAGVLGVLDQAIHALESLSGARRTGAATTDPVTDIALLRFGLVQFTGCFRRTRGSDRLTPRQAFGTDGAKFFEHVSSLTEQLTGDHARVVGEVETVVLLKRSGDLAGVVGLTTRTRRPDRLTSIELASLVAFMERGRAAYRTVFDATRTTVMSEVERLGPQALLALELKESAT